MIFSDTTINGAFVIEPNAIQDERGFFARVLCEVTFGERGLISTFSQTNMALSYVKGTLRGLHFQRDPHAEVKVVRCTKGAVYDVIVDLRPDSPSYKKWYGVELSEENRRTIYVPEGCAQGYLTLADNSEIYYHTSAPYCPSAAFGVRYNDPAFGIAWPENVVVLSQQDQTWPDHADVNCYSR